MTPPADPGREGLAEKLREAWAGGPPIRPWATLDEDDRARWLREADAALAHATGDEALRRERNEALGLLRVIDASHWWHAGAPDVYRKRVRRLIAAPSSAAAAPGAPGEEAGPFSRALAATGAAPWMADAFACAVPSERYAEAPTWRVDVQREDDRYRVWLHVGVQHFAVGDPREKDSAEWFAKQLRAAMRRAAGLDDLEQRGAGATPNARDASAADSGGEGHAQADRERRHAAPSPPLAPKCAACAAIAQDVRALKDYFDLGETVFNVSNRWPFARDCVETAYARLAHLMPSEAIPTPAALVGKTASDVVDAATPQPSATTRATERPTRVRVVKPTNYEPSLRAGQEYDVVGWHGSAPLLSGVIDYRSGKDEWPEGYDVDGEWEPVAEPAAPPTPAPSPSLLPEERALLRALAVEVLVGPTRVGALTRMAAKELQAIVAKEALDVPSR